MLISFVTFWLYFISIFAGKCFTISFKDDNKPEKVWIDLSTKEYDNWYSRTDRCMLKTEDRIQYPQVTKTDVCGNYSDNFRGLKCSVGMGHKYSPCFGPYSSARPSFRKGIMGYTNSSTKPLLETLVKLIDTNTSIVILGDSTLRQKLQALECELLRELPLNFQPFIKISNQHIGGLNCYTRLSISIAKDVYLQLLNTLYSNQNLSLESRKLSVHVGEVVGLYNNLGRYLKQKGSNSGVKSQSRLHDIRSDSIRNQFIIIDIHGISVGKSAANCLRVRFLL